MLLQRILFQRSTRACPAWPWDSFGHVNEQGTLTPSREDPVWPFLPYPWVRGSDGSTRQVVQVTNVQVETVEEWRVRQGAEGGMVVIEDASDAAGEAQEIVDKVRRSDATAFICVLSVKAETDWRYRLAMFKSGANMVTRSLSHVADAALRWQCIGRGTGRLRCPLCACQNLSEDELWLHVPFYHIYDAARNEIVLCPQCNQSMPQRGWSRHYRNEHGPPGRGEVPNERVLNRPVIIYPFALCVVERRNARGEMEMLLCQEYQKQGFWLPGGKVDAGEDLLKAAVRETLEEAGVHVRLDGVLRFEYSSGSGKYVRLRVILHARLLEEDQVEKSLPDYESAGAVWMTYNDISEAFHDSKLRGSEPYEWSQYLANGGVVYPLSVLGREGDPIQARGPNQ